MTAHEVMSFGTDKPPRPTSRLMIGVAVTCLVVGFLAGLRTGDAWETQGDEGEAAKELTAEKEQAEPPVPEQEPTQINKTVLIGGSFYQFDRRTTTAAQFRDPGHLLFNVLAMVAEFESDLIRLRTREGMEVAKDKGRLRGKQPKLNRRQEAHLVSLVHSGEYSTAEVAELFGVGRSTAPSNANASKRELASCGRHRSADPRLTAPAVPHPAPARNAGASPCPHRSDFPHGVPLPFL